MLDRAVLFGIISSGITLAVVLELVRRRRLREEYSLLWLMTALVLLFTGSNRALLDWLAKSIGIYYPPSALFLIAIVFVLLLLLHTSTVLTRLTQENKQIAQEVALLKEEVRRLKAESHAPPVPTDDPTH
ncbi:MAG: DUF2304 domain-containing protein [Phototrophicaceae bacterium]